MALQAAVSDDAGMVLPNRIQELREDRGWSRPELARRMNTSGQQIERLEKGQRRLSDVWLTRAADALEVAPFELIAPAGLLPTEDELTAMLSDAQKSLPAGLPFSEWPRAVASDLRRQLALLVNDRAIPHSADDSA